jgi:isoleucyl-tRNA synthetase
MSKSLGNTIAPEEIIEKYGADIIRLWAVSSDYSVDIRISEEILDQLVDAYRKLRNTIRFMLGNLYGFNPKVDSVPYNELEPLDKWLLHRLQKVTGSVLEYYNKWEFHLITKELLNFCNIDLSSFYLDIVKDRLYCSGPSIERKKAQTVLFKTLDNLLRLLAPILSFTTDEAYWVLTEEVLKPSGIETEESIHLCLFPEVEVEYINEELAEEWETLIEIRKNVLKPIEELRVAKVIGHSLESEVTIFASGKAYKILMKNLEELAPLFVVSKVDVQKLESSGEDKDDREIKIDVKRSKASKCLRCWRYLESVGRNKSYPDLCDRCASVIVKYYH